VRDAPDWELGEVGESELGTAKIDRTRTQLPAQDGRNFQVHQLGCSKDFPANPGSRPVAVVSVVGECGRDDAGVNDEHVRPAAP
jgi:hypothetical protein